MKTAAEMIEYYKSDFLPEHWLEEIMWQYIEMAQSRDGGEMLGFDGSETSCREYNYPDAPDSFFQEVCDGMGWDWRSSQ